MNVNFSLAAVLGVAAASMFALPAHAGVLTTPTNVSGTVGNGAFGVDNLLADGKTYNVKFNYGKFDVLYGNPSAPGSYAGDPFGPNMGIAILKALNTYSPKVTSLVNANLASFGSSVLTNFYIPEFSTGQNGITQVVFLDCALGNTACTPTTRSANQNGTDNLLYAQYMEVPGNTVPTPALLPGLLGLGLAALRKKQQAEAVAA
jgi:hypothetical protein